MNSFSPPEALALNPDDYCVLGLATCYLRDEGAVHPIEVIEPIPSAALEAILKGVPTSFRWAIAVTVGQVSPDNPPAPPFPPEAQWCDNFTERLGAATRTYNSRPQARTHIALGQTYGDFNYSVDRKRVLNASHLVRPEDNVKQHPLTHQTL